MFKDKKFLFLFAIIVIELFIIILLAILRNNKNSVSYDPLDEYSSANEYCQLFEDERCDELEEIDYFENHFNTYAVDPDSYKDSFLLAYASILKGASPSQDQFANFVALSNEYSKAYDYAEPISGNNLPSTYFASSYKFESDYLANSYAVIRRINLEIPSVGCATFDFSADFQLLQNYYLEEGSCDALD